MFNYKTSTVLDDKGRIVIPVKIRESLELKKGDLLGIEYQDGIIQIYAIADEQKGKQIQE